MPTDDGANDAVAAMFALRARTNARDGARRRRSPDGLNTRARATEMKTSSSVDASERSSARTMDPRTPAVTKESRGRRTGGSTTGRSRLGGSSETTAFERALARGGATTAATRGRLGSETFANNTRGSLAEAFDAAAARLRDVSASEATLERFAERVTPGLGTSSRRGRRSLGAHERTHVCGVDGCDKSYGSASSLCTHRRVRHAGWRERVRDAADGAVEDKGGDGEGKGVDADVDRDTTVRLARKRGASGLDDSTRASPLGVYLEILAADAHGRLGVGDRTKARLSRATKDAITTAADPIAFVERRAASAAAARLFASMESASAREHERTSAWLFTLDDVSKTIIHRDEISVDPSEIDRKRVASCVDFEVAHVLRSALAR